MRLEYSVLSTQYSGRTTASVDSWDKSASIAPPGAWPRAASRRDRLAPPARLGPRHPAGTSSRVQARLEQRLVGVDVAHAGHDALVEEDRLDAAAGPAQPFAPFGRVE